MTDFTKPHGPQGPTIEAADKRPWKAPRLVDLDDIIEVEGPNTDGMGNPDGIGTANDKLPAVNERHDTGYNLHYGGAS